MKFGQFIKDTRERAGWTQPEAAQKIGVEQSYLSKLENGRNYPAEEIFDQILNVYSIDLAALCASVGDEDLVRLKEIRQVRALFQAAAKQRKTSLRAMVVSALGMLAVGAGLTAHELIAPEFVTYHWQHYRSYGVIRDGESLNLFNYAFRDEDQSVYNISEISARLDYDFVKTVENRGEMYVVKVDDGRRRYDWTHQTIDKLSGRNQTLIGLGAALFTLGLAGMAVCWTRSRASK